MARTAELQHQHRLYFNHRLNGSKVNVLYGLENVWAFLGKYFGNFGFSVSLWKQFPSSVEGLPTDIFSVDNSNK